MTTLRRILLPVAAVIGIAILVLGLAAVAGRPPGGEQRSVAPAPRPGVTAPLALSGAGAEALAAGLQVRLKEQPRDARGWAQLGIAYVEQARLTTDPSYYPKAELALMRSLELRPRDNDLALVGLGALAAGRHDFIAAAEHARAAIAVNPDSAAAYGVLADALTELGQYDAALAAARHMDNLRPGLASRARLSYQAELRGDIDGARRLLADALAEPLDPADAAYVHSLIADLEWSAGQLESAERHYAAALAAEPGYVPAMFGSARTRAARGDLDGAIELAAAVAARQPTIEHLRWYGELLDAAGRHGEAHAQYELAHAAADLQQAQGVTLDMEVALLAADHGDPASAVRAGRAALDERPSILAEDAYAWALHVVGRSAEALEHAERAARLGTKSAQFAYHKGMIELDLGLNDAARRDLERALTLNPDFSIRDAPRAKTALRTLGGAK